MPVLGTDLAIHLGIELGINLAGAGGGPVPPVLEAPLLVPGLKAWFDSRDPAYFALGGGGEVSAWLSRAGSIAGLAWTQGTAANQPIRVASEPLFNNMPAVLFDGVNDNLLANNGPAWTFLHNNTGCSSFRVFWTDPTGPGVQAFIANGASSASIGVLQSLNTNNLSAQIFRGVAPSLNFFTAVNHLPRGVARWHMLGHGDNVAHSRISGINLTNPDDMSAPASAANPTSVARMGASSAGSSLFFKGHRVQEIYYDHVLTTPELTSLATWAASIYGVAA